MTARSPTLETIQVINRILSVRSTPPGELAQVIATIGDALANLATPSLPALPLKAMPKPLKIVDVARMVRAKKRPQIPVSPPVLARAPSVAKRVEEPPRRRGRPRRVAVEAVVETIVPPPAQLAPQPKLLRRAQVVAQEAEHRIVEAPQVLTRPSNGTIRGVVKWFDSRAGKGAVRLTGISGDLQLDAGLLSRSGIKRLYKDQEIEAAVADKGGRISILSLALPGRAAPIGGGKSSDGGLQNQRRQVMIEVKRDNSRQKSARAEAEQVFANVGVAKTSRITSA